MCPETIYQAVYNKLLDVRARKCLRWRHRRRRPRQTRHASTRAVLPSINQRPPVVTERSEPGHWEIDTIIGARNQSGMVWLCERVSKFTIPVTLPRGYAVDEVLAGLIEAFETIPSHLLRSVAFDQGSEWAEWETIASTCRLECGSVSRTRRGSAVSPSITTDRSAGGSRVASTSVRCDPNTPKPLLTCSPPTPTQPQRQAPPCSTLPTPRADHWNWPSRRSPRPYPRRASKRPGGKMAQLIKEPQTLLGVISLTALGSASGLAARHICPWRALSLRTKQ